MLSTAKNARENIQSKKGKPMILHYDRNIVKELTKGKKLSRQGCTYCKNWQSKLCTRCAPLPWWKPILWDKYTLNDYDVKDDKVGLVFDTTASNTVEKKE